MAIPSESEIKSMSGEALKMLRDGDLFGAINQQTQLVDKIMVLGPKLVNAQGLADTLEDAASRMVDMLRWAGMYGPAIVLQERLIDYLPPLAEALHLGAANLRVESNIAEAVEAGLQQLHDMVSSAPENYWYRISLACALMYVEQFDEAEQVLREAALMSHVRKVDRAMAQEHLFGLMERQGKVDEALLAWREAARLDHTLRMEMLPDVCRMLIYWRKFAEARKHIAMDTVQVRRQFFLGLVEFFEANQAEAVNIWRSVLSAFDPVTLTAGQDEFAETCLRVVNPNAAIMTLEKLVEGGQTSFYRSVILGLAYAQRGLLNRARFHLDIAMRLADMERPRLTLPSGEKRVLAMIAGILYNGIPLDPAVRKEIETYFIPLA